MTRTASSASAGSEAKLPVRPPEPRGERSSTRPRTGRAKPAALTLWEQPDGEAPTAPPAPRAASAPCAGRLLGPPPLSLPLPGEELSGERAPQAPRGSSRPPVTGTLLQESPKRAKRSSSSKAAVLSATPLPAEVAPAEQASSRPVSSAGGRRRHAAGTPSGSRSHRRSSRTASVPEATEQPMSRSPQPSLAVVKGGDWRLEASSSTSTKGVSKLKGHSQKASFGAFGSGGSTSLFGLGSPAQEELGAGTGASALALDLGLDAAASAAARHGPAPQAPYGLKKPPKLTKGLLPAISTTPSNAGAIAWRMDLQRGEGRRSRSIF